jgi:hypothetical protein
MGSTDPAAWRVASAPLQCTGPALHGFRPLMAFW